MASKTPPAAYSPKAKGDEVLSQRTFPGQGESQEAVRVALEGETSAAGHMGKQIPMEAGGGGRVQFGPPPNTILETYMASESGVQPPSREGGAPSPSASSINPEAPDILVEALQSASIVEEHRSLMGTVVGNIQAAESGLNESCLGLIKAFEVWFLRNL